MRYQEVGDDGTPAFAPQVGTLCPQSAMPGGKIPKELRVNVQSVKADKPKSSRKIWGC